MNRAESPFYTSGLTRDYWEALPEATRVAVLDQMSDQDVEAFGKDWRVWAWDYQLPPPGLWRLWFLLCGRGAGKTRTAVECVLDKVERGEKGRICLLGQGESDVREVMIEGPSGFLACSKSWFRPTWRPSRGGGLLEWPNGAVGHVYSAEDPEALRGPEFDLAWIDEVMAFKAEARAKAESNLRFGLRYGPNPQRIYTTTPRAHKWLRAQLAKVNPAKGVYLTQATTFQNARNLPNSFLEGVQEDYGNTRLGNQELRGEVLNDSDNALWTTETLDQCRVLQSVPDDDVEQAVQAFSRQLDQVIVAVDPNMTASGTSHAAGIVVLGMKADKRYLLADYTVRGKGPAEWGKQVVRAFDEWRATEVVAEVNQGGDLVRFVVDQMADEAGIDVPVYKVHATRGKQKRAEPIAAAYERGKIHHVGPAQRYATIETQMCDLHEAHDTTGEDFDRCDAVVWGMTRLVHKSSSLANVGGSGIFSFADFLGA